MVTRASHQAVQQIDILKQCGADVTHLPLLLIEPVQEGTEAFHLIKHQMMNLDLYDIIICISPNAANYALEWIDQYWPQLPIGIDWYAIGRKTAQILNAAEIPARFSPKGFDSEAILCLSDLQDVAEKKVLILRGSDGRKKLEESLSGRGAQVEYANLYTRHCPDYADDVIKSTIYNQDLSSILITSGEALNNFVKVAQGQKSQFSVDSLSSIRLIVPSKRIAEQAKKSGFTQITVAQGPDDQSMIAALNSANDSETNA